MIESKAKEAAEARAQLQQALMQCAEAMTKVAETVTASAIELAAASENEHAATLAYITELEFRLSQQRRAM